MSFRYRYAPFIFIALLVALTFGLLALVRIQPRQSITVLPDSALLTAQYQSAVRTILNEYQTTDRAMPLASELTVGQRAEWRAAAVGWRDQLLSISVPGAYRDFHLQLVLQFDALGQSMAGGGTTASTVAQKLQQLVDQTPWVTATSTAQ